MLYGYLVTNNACDTFVIMQGDTCRAAYTLATAQDWRDATATGADQYLANWSSTGGAPADDATPDDYGDVIAINDGVTLRVVDSKLYAQRRAFWLRK